MISFDHIRKLCREDIVAAVLAFFLTSVWINVLDRQVLVEGLRIELTLGRLAVFKVDNRRNFHIARVLLLLCVLSALRVAQSLAISFICVCVVVLRPFVDQNIDVGEELDFATATEIGRSRPQSCVV